MIFCALAILVTQREEVFVFASRKRNVSLQASIDPLAKHPMNLRISAQTLTYSCQICQMTSTPHVIITGNFNVRFPQLLALDKENNKGREISFFTSFLNLKIYILIHIRLCGRVSDKHFFNPADFRKQDYFFLALLNVFHNLIPNKKIEFNFKDQRYCRVGPTVNDRNRKD